MTSTSRAVEEDIGPSNAENQMELKISDFHGFGFPKTILCIASKANRFYFKLECGGESRVSQGSRRGREPVWNETFSFKSPTGSLKMTVYVHHILVKDQIIGAREDTIDNIISKLDGDGKYTCTLKLTDNAQAENGTPTVCFKASLGNSLEILKSHVELGKKEWAGVQTAPDGIERSSQALVQGANLQSVAATVMDDVMPFLDRIDKFVKLVDNLSEVHPYAKIAWSVMSAGYKVLQAQQQRDAALSRLVDVIDDTYAFIIESQDLSKVPSQRKIAEELAKQTTECAYFILHYVEDKEFLTRTFHNMLGDADANIQAFQDTFTELKAAFQARAVVHTELVVIQTIGLTKQIAVDVNLNDMAYAGDASFVPEKGCFPGTRTAIIDAITQWTIRPVENKGGSLFWLKGFAGSGKSAVAHTIAHLFSTSKRLGSSFIFDQSHATQRQAEAVFLKITRDLASLSSDWKNALAEVIQDSPELRHTPSVRRQFEELILRPAKKITFIGPILIILDALDECGGSSDSRRELLSILSSRLSELPSNFRILLTSRPEDEIEQAFTGIPYILKADLQAISMNSTIPDLSIYYTMRLGKVQELDTKWSNRGWLPHLIERSEGLFQWAFTACEFILEPGWEPAERLESLISTSELSGIDKLYMAILHNIFRFSEDDGRLPRFRSVLGRVLCVRQPLSVTDLTALRSTQESAGTTRAIIRMMGSVLSGVSSHSTPVQALHTSFRDFLFSQERSGIYHVDYEMQEDHLVRACLTVLNTELKFNITDSPSSHILAPPATDTTIPGYIMYASKFWATHLPAIPFSGELLTLVRFFSDQQFLYWLEILASTQNLLIARSSMSSLRRWAMVADPALAEFCRDAESFIHAFAGIIAQSPPHLYISALPFAPETSLVAKKYLPRFDRTLVVESGKPHAYTALQRTFGHRGGVLDSAIYTMAYTPDGSTIITISLSQRVSFWNAETGQSTDGLPPEETVGFSSLAISPDGKYFALGSWVGSLCVRDIKTHSILWGPTKLHENTMDIIQCMKFTLDSRILWAITKNGYVRCWEAETGLAIVPSERLHTYKADCAAFSFDATCLAVGQAPGSILVCRRSGDEEHWQELCVLLFDSIKFKTVTFSPNKEYLISGSYDGEIQIWALRTRSVIGKSLHRRLTPVYGIAVSPDGKIIASSSEDTTIHLWSFEGGDLGTPLTGFETLVTELAFSPNGEHIASGAADGTICVWDCAAAVGASPEPPEEELALGASVTSSDRKYLLAVAGDRTVRSYDPDTGAEVRPPLRVHTKNISMMAVASHMPILAYCTSEADGQLFVLDAETGAPLREPIEVHTAEVNNIEFNDDGTRLLSCSEDKTIRVWDTTTWDLIGKPLEGHTSRVATAVFLPGDDRILSASDDRTLRIWSVETSESIAGPLTFHEMAVFALGVASISNLVASGSIDGVIRLWDSDTLSCDGYPTLNHGADIVCSLSFSSDGKRLLSGGGDHAIRLWDVSTGQLIGIPWEGHTGVVTWADFLGNEDRIISSAFEGIIRVWDTTWKSSNNTSSDFELRKSFPRISQDGWVYADEHPMKVLFWVPPSYRPTFLWGLSSRLIGARPITLNFDRFEFGEQWTRCCSKLTKNDTV
ncbi:WD40 repeat-like protein [Sistotremastrum suecicum HHB10207 ss-3]|uniref:WD40 repeat-like protein n=1 Tax=Sistotremastrum suecicum HHB10207 ss-3 TaxID=1314776 RepID=A0A166F794_9AGAM|nr:WD40 repeat-like protein [Sistotremastrum suecicum HHB10207 ss-3]